MNIENTQDTPGDHSAGDRPLGFWLRTVDALISREFAAAFDGEGATRRDWMLLNAVSGDVNAPGFAERAARKGGKHLRGLEQRGWVEESGDGTWVLTEEGDAAKERLGGIVDDPLAGFRRRIARGLRDHARLARGDRARARLGRKRYVAVARLRRRLRSRARFGRGGGVASGPASVPEASVTTSITISARISTRASVPDSVPAAARRGCPTTPTRTSRTTVTATVTRAATAARAPRPRRPPRSRRRKRLRARLRRRVQPRTDRNRLTDEY